LRNENNPSGCSKEQGGEDGGKKGEYKKVQKDKEALVDNRRKRKRDKATRKIVLH